MPDETLIEQLNRGYVCPPDAGPAWRAAYEAGIDMSAIERALEMTPEQRLAPATLLAYVATTGTIAPLPSPTTLYKDDKN